MSDQKKPLGIVTIQLEGKAVELEPTMEACMAVSRIAGGIGSAIERVSRLDFDTIVEIIAHGMGLNPGQRDRQLRPAVFAEGLIKLAPDVILFLRIIANGGRYPDDDEDGEDGDQADSPLAEKESA